MERKKNGFLPNRSTTDALIQVIENWSDSLDKKLNVHAVFFDFSKEFDLVQHDLLLKKLETYLPNWLIKWLANYLVSRKQRVKVGEITSERKNVEAGVIQGSVLGPILFILFIADINEYIPLDTNLAKYADDIITYEIFKLLTQDRTQDSVDGISKWSHTNRTKLNTDKTKRMIIGKKDDIDTKIYLDGSELEVVDEYKYLGIYVNDKLDWDEHWTHICKKINSTSYLIKTMKRFGFREEILINIYRSLVLGQIISSAVVLCSVSNKTLQEMEMTQSKFLKIIGISSDVAQNKYKIAKIPDLIDNHCLNLLRKILSDENHPITKGLVKREELSTRYRFPFRIEKCNSERHQNTFLQKYLRLLEKEKFELKSIKNLKQNNTDQSHSILEEPTTSIPMVKCDKCGNLFKNSRGLKIHEGKKHK